MAIPLPNPNINDFDTNDLQTWSSSKIKAEISSTSNTDVVITVNPEYDADNNLSFSLADGDLEKMKCAITNNKNIIIKFFDPDDTIHYVLMPACKYLKYSDTWHITGTFFDNYDYANKCFHVSISASISGNTYEIFANKSYTMEWEDFT